MCENGKPWIVSKVVWICIKKERLLKSLNFRKEINSVIFSSSCA